MRTRFQTKVALAAMGALALTGALAACDSGGSNGGGSTAGGSADASGDCAAFSQYGDLSGKSIEVYTSIIEAEGEEQQASYKKFEDCTGATIEYNGSREFEAQLPVRVDGGDAPDIAYIPQPGLLATMVATGKVVKPPAAVEQNVDKYWSESWKGYGTVDGTFYAAPLGASAKSFVWYSPKMFEDGGYTVPTTWDELMTLTDKIAADHPDLKPWCAGIESGDATGWPGTDWLEDMVLRVAGPEKYDQWVSHEIPFNDPSIVESLDAMGKILKDPKYVNGGWGDVKSIASTPWSDAGSPIQDGKCYMMRAASFYQAYWKEGTKISSKAADDGVYAFYLPSMNDTKPVEGAGEFVTAFNDDPAVQAFQTYLSTADWANEKAKNTPNGGWVTANTGLDPANLSSEFDKVAYEMVSSKEFRFDGSDLMPSKVGAGTFWKGMIDYFTTDKSSTEILTTINDSWPAIQAVDPPPGRTSKRTDEDPWTGY